MSYTRTAPVMFKHCDPAGLMFYPRYFEMTNDTVELFFARRLGLPFHVLHETASIPTAKISAEFKAPSRLGDELEIEMCAGRIGRSSIELSFTGHCDDQLRFTAEATLVYINLDGRPQSWPVDLKSRLQSELGDS